MLFQIYSFVINKCQCEIKLEDKMEKQINEKKPWFPKLFNVINSLKQLPVRFGMFLVCVI